MLPHEASPRFPTHLGDIGTPNEQKETDTMARNIRSADLENRTNRLRLELRKKPYTARIGYGIRLAYRRNQSGGTWSVICSAGKGGTGKQWLQCFARADDHEEANGGTVLTYWQAQAMARRIAGGGSTADAGERPVTMSEAIDAFERDLEARSARTENATWLRFHLKGSPLLDKPVNLLTVKEVRAFRDGLVAKVKRSTVNRYMKALAACLTL